MMKMMGPQIVAGKILKNNGTHRNSISFLIGSTVGIQGDDGGPRKHEATVKSNSTDYIG